MAESLYSTAKISDRLIEEIKEALKGLDFGSIELYVQNGEITQITRRDIRKTNNLIQK